MNKKTKNIQIGFAVSGTIMLAIIVFAIIYSLDFVSTNFIRAFSLPGEQGQVVEFNIEAYQKLNLK